MKDACEEQLHPRVNHLSQSKFYSVNKEMRLYQSTLYRSELYRTWIGPV